MCDTPFDAELARLREKPDCIPLAHQTKNLGAKNPPKCAFLTVFRFFQGHPLTLRDSKGHIRILLFRDASNGTGPVPLGPREPQKRLFSNKFGKHVFGFDGVAVALAVGQRDVDFSSVVAFGARWGHGVQGVHQQKYTKQN